jgi:hypothetical protein
MNQKVRPWKPDFWNSNEKKNAVNSTGNGFLTYLSEWPIFALVPAFLLTDNNYARSPTA